MIIREADPIFGGCEINDFWRWFVELNSLGDIVNSKFSLELLIFLHVAHSNCHNKDDDMCSLGILAVNMEWWNVCCSIHVYCSTFIIFTKFSACQFVCCVAEIKTSLSFSQKYGRQFSQLRENCIFIRLSISPILSN